MRNIAIYENVYSADENDIPKYSRYIRYDMSALVNDFGGFIGKDPRQGGSYEDGKDFNIVTDYITEQNAIYFNREDKGEFTVYYKKRLPTISTSTLDSYELQFDVQLLQALLYKVCAKISFLDDETERSVYFENEFNLVAVNIAEQIKVDSRIPAQYKNTTNWW